MTDETDALHESELANVEVVWILWKWLVNQPSLKDLPINSERKRQQNHHLHTSSFVISQICHCTESKLQLFC